MQLCFCRFYGSGESLAAARCKCFLIDLLEGCVCALIFDEMVLVIFIVLGKGSNPSDCEISSGVSVSNCCRKRFRKLTGVSTFTCTKRNEN